MQNQLQNISHKKIANDPKNFERTNSKTLNRLKSKLKSYISEHCATISTKNHLALFEWKGGGGIGEGVDWIFISLTKNYLFLTR